MKKTLLLLLSALIFTAGAAIAQPTNGSLPAYLKPKTISVFKNNSAFFVKSGSIPVQNGKFVISDSLPLALFGTLWFNSPQLEGVASYVDSVEKEMPSQSIAQMLEINVGKQVSLTVLLEEEVQEISGELKGFKPGIVTLLASDGWNIIPVPQIVRANFKQEPKTTLKQKERSRMIELNFSSGVGSSAPIDMMYLQNGLGWMPNYKVELLNDTRARLSLRALLVNDAEDIEGAELQFVVGVPSFNYADRVSPLVDAARAARIMTGLAANGAFRNGSFDNTFATQTIAYEVDDRSNFAAGAGAGLDGEQTEDLFFYRVPNASLPLHGRAFYDLFEAEIPIEHIYESQLSANPVRSNGYRSSHSFDAGNKVIHKIKMTNNTNYPWTTGSALAISAVDGGTRPLSQDRILYTAREAESFLTLTEAPEIKVLHSEVESSREARKLNRDKYHYDLVKVSGEIKVKNYKNKKVALNVRRTITGKLIESSEKWLTARNPANAAPNSVTDVCWELELKPGEEQIIKYTYEVYLR